MARVIANQFTLGKGEQEIPVRLYSKVKTHLTPMGEKRPERREDNDMRIYMGRQMTSVLILLAFLTSFLKIGLFLIYYLLGQ